MIQVGNPLRGISGGVISIDSDAMITVLIFIAEYYQRRILIRRLGPGERYSATLHSSARPGHRIGFRHFMSRVDNNCTECETFYVFLV